MLRISHDGWVNLCLRKEAEKGEMIFVEEIISYVVVLAILVAGMIFGIPSI